jgi:signal transduction histidine kinase
MKWSLFAKIFAALLVVSLLPLLISALLLGYGLSGTSDRLASHLSTAINQQAAERLEQQASQVAADVARFLNDCEDDLRLAATLADNPDALVKFYAIRQEKIWHRIGSPEAPEDVREIAPCYTSLEITDAHGRQTFVIRQGRRLPAREFRNVADPAATDYRSEDYFRRAAALFPGEVYVSHVTGFHVSKEEQLRGAPDPERAIGGGEYTGVVRFATPRFDDAGRFSGIIALALDHRHLMEFTQHILPGRGGPTVFPSYQSGNYAFMFDDEGWIITHPKYWDIRGLDRQGRLIPPYTASSSREDVQAGRIPFNLDHAGFIHPNYPVVAARVRQGQSGSLDVTNVGGAKKVMAFAPIPYRTGDYNRFGIFGGITIGYQADQFQEPARIGVTLLREGFQQQLNASFLIITFAAVLVLICALLTSRGITKPLALLTMQARSLANGESTRPVEVTTSDEVRDLAETFNRMAVELEARKQGLLATLDQLRISEQETAAERNFKTSILESISSAILTFSPDGLLSSINGTGQRLLGTEWRPGDSYGAILAGKGDLADQLGQVLASQCGFGRRSLAIAWDGQTRHFDVGFFPIASEAGGGVTLTIRDETERERLREEMVRLDRLASLGKLSAGIAHEVRNPLTGISLLLDDLHDHLTADPENQALIARALAEIERVERLITSLLSYAAPPAAEFRIGDLNAMVLDVQFLFRRSCTQQGVELTCSCGDLPLLPFDGEKLRQALINLVKNAQEALPDGGAIEIATACSGGMALITVRDTGPGIPADDLPHLFEPFFTRKGAGTGLGLSITQRIIDEHGGTIDVTTTSTAGTTFTIRLPLHERG